MIGGIGLPSETTFHTEPALALEMITELVKRSQLPFAWITADEHFGQNPGFLDGVAALGKWYFAEVPTTTRVWLRTPPLCRPGPSSLGQPRPQPRVAPNAPQPVTARDWLHDLPAGRWRRYTIKEGSRGPMVAAFAFGRVTVVRDRLPALTVPQARQLIAQALAAETDRPDPLAVLCYHQERNHAAYRSHRKRTREHLRQPATRRRPEISLSY